MSNPTASQHISSFDLDRLETLDENKKQSIDEHLRSCAVCRQDHESLRQLRSEFSEKVFPRTIERVRERAGSTSRSWFLRPEALGPLLASAAVLLVWIGAGWMG